MVPVTLPLVLCLTFSAGTSKLSPGRRPDPRRFGNAAFMSNHASVALWVCGFVGVLWVHDRSDAAHHFMAHPSSTPHTRLAIYSQEGLRKTKEAA